MKSVLIIGGDSYIASQFITTKFNNYNFKIVSRKKTGFPNEIVVNNFFEIDIQIFKEIDVIVNFAAIVHKSNKVSKALYKKINFDLPVFLFDCSKRNNVKHFIQISTISVYKRSKIINEYSLEKPNTNYGYFKLKTDRFLLNQSNKNIKISCVRPPMVYGNKAPGNMVKLIKLAKKNIPLPFKNATKKGTFINILNLVDFIDIVIKKDLTNVLLPSDKYSTSTKEIIEIVRESRNSPKNLFSIPAFLDKLMKLIIPEIYTKIFDPIEIETNISNEIFEPNHDIKDGILKILNLKYD